MPINQDHVQEMKAIVMARLMKAPSLLTEVVDLLQKAGYTFEEWKQASREMVPLGFLVRLPDGREFMVAYAMFPAATPEISAEMAYRHLAGIQTHGEIKQLDNGTIGDDMTGLPNAIGPGVEGMNLFVELDRKEQRLFLVVAEKKGEGKPAAKSRLILTFPQAEALARTIMDVVAPAPPVNVSPSTN